MKNEHKSFLVIDEPIVDRHRRRLFENKLSEARSLGFQIVGSPVFSYRNDDLFGTILMQMLNPKKRKRRNEKDGIHK